MKASRACVKKVVLSFMVLKVNNRNLLYCEEPSTLSCVPKFLNLNLILQEYSSERLLSPAIFFHYLLFFLGCKVILDVEELANLFYVFALDHGGDLCAAQLEQRLDIEVVGGHHNLKQRLLVYIYVVSVPRLNHLRQVS